MATAVGVLKDGKIDFPKRLHLPGWWVSVIDVHGRYPDQLDLIATGTTGRTGVAEHYALGAKGWERRVSNAGQWFTGVARMGSSLVGLAGPTMIGALAVHHAARARGGADDHAGAQEGECRGFDFEGASPILARPKSARRHSGRRAMGRR